MDFRLENINHPALEDARAAGRNHLTQTEEAVRAGLKDFLEKTACNGITFFTAMPNSPWMLPVFPNKTDRQALDAWVKLEDQDDLT